MIIRAGASDEREACVSIWLDALRARDGAEQGPDVAARARAKFTRPIVRFAVAGPGPSAFALTVDTGTDSSKRVAMFELLAVAPDDAGHGIGRALVADAIEAATKAGYSAMELSVRAGNDRAAKLYSSCGFTRQGDPVPHPLGGPPMLGYALRLPA